MICDQVRKRAFGTYEIAGICQVTPPTIGRWIAEGKLPCFTTVGGHHRVWDQDLLVLLKANNIPIPPELRSASRSRILIVEDEPFVRRLMTRILEKSIPNVEVLEAGDGFEAGQKIASHIPSLVVLDIFLPGIDGYKVCRLIRSDDRLKDVKILAVSGSRNPEHSTRILKSGADDFISKPFQQEEFIFKVRKHLSAQRTALRKAA